MSKVSLALRRRFERLDTRLAEDHVSQDRQTGYTATVLTTANKDRGEYTTEFQDREIF